MELNVFSGFGGCLTTALGDQFVFGLRNERVQQKLLKDKNLTLDVAVETAALDETASPNKHPTGATK